jgi:hypothetical protein
MMQEGAMWLSTDADVDTQCGQETASGSNRPERKYSKSLIASASPRLFSFCLFVPMLQRDSGLDCDCYLEPEDLSLPDAISALTESSPALIQLIPAAVSSPLLTDTHDLVFYIQRSQINSHAE